MVVIVLAMGVVVTAVALGLCGLICRGRYRPLALYLWLLLLLAGRLAAGRHADLCCVTIAQSEMVEFGEFFLPVLVAAAVHFAVLLPFLILSSACPFYRERLKALLHAKPEQPPVPPLVPPLLPEASLRA